MTLWTEIKLTLGLGICVLKSAIFSNVCEITIVSHSGHDWFVDMPHSSLLRKNVSRRYHRLTFSTFPCLLQLIRFVMLQKTWFLAKIEGTCLFLFVFPLLSTTSTAVSFVSGTPPWLFRVAYSILSSFSARLSNAVTSPEYNPEDSLVE